MRWFGVWDLVECLILPPGAEPMTAEDNPEYIPLKPPDAQKPPFACFQKTNKVEYTLYYPGGNMCIPFISPAGF